MVEQLTKQLYKLINVLKVQELTEGPCVERELMLLKVNAKQPESALKSLSLPKSFGLGWWTWLKDSLTLEVVGDPRQKWWPLFRSLNRYGIREIARTGKIALPRESGVNTPNISSPLNASYSNRWNHDNSNLQIPVVVNGACGKMGPRSDQSPLMPQRA